MVYPKEVDPFKGLKIPVPNPHKKSKDLSEIEEAREEFGQLNRGRRKLDLLTEKLGQNGYYSKARLPWLKFQHRFGIAEPMTVDRYYPKLKLLLDISVEKPADGPDRIKLKKELARSQGFFYFNIESEADLQTMYMTIPAGAS